MHPVRRAVLEILKREDQATVSELAERLEMAPVSVRHHLDLLIGDGLVTTPRVLRSSTAGRPQQVYTLTPEADAYFPNSYRQLASGSLAALKRTLPAEEVLAVMRSLARDTAAPAAAKLADLPPEQRLRRAASVLNELGYMAGYEEDADSIVLNTCNCPYSDLAPEHPELCHMDLALVMELTGLEPERVHHMGAGDSRCSYRFDLRNEHTNKVSLPLLVDAGARSVRNA